MDSMFKRYIFAVHERHGKLERGLLFYFPMKEVHEKMAL